MKTPMSSQETIEIRDSLLSGDISVDQAIYKLTESGIEPDAAKSLVAELIRQHKRTIFDQAVEKKNAEDIRGVTVFLTLMISLIGPVFEIKSTAWYMIVIVAVAIAGYKGYKDRPIAGILGYLCFALVFPFSYANYFANRESYVRIEMLIPVILAGLPSLILLYLLSKAIYKKGLY